MSESAPGNRKVVRLPTGVSVFGPFRFERRTGRLSRGDAEIHLTPRASDVLRCLVARPGEVLTKDELFAQVWKDVNVTDDALLQVVSAVRKALGDDPRRPEYIQTVTGEGYRFIAEVSEAGVEPAATTGLVAVPGPGSGAAKVLDEGTTDSDVASVTGEPVAGVTETQASQGRLGTGLTRQRDAVFVGRRGRAFRVAVGLAVAAVLALGWLIVNGNAQRWLGSSERRSIAVLPFANLSGDPAEDYFSDGLAEELIGVLGAIDGLRVAARTSSFAFKGDNRDVRGIAEQLGVDHVLEGSARRDGDRVRVSARLVDAGSGFQLWSEIYDRERTGVFAIQQDIAARVAESLTLPLMGESAARVARAPTESLEAYDAYLQGRFFLARQAIDSFRAAAASFQRAVDLDPDFGLAFVGLADAYLLQNRFGALTLGEAAAMAEPAIDRALQLDNRLGEAHAMRGFVLQRQGRIEEAERAYQRALELNPDSARTYQLYFWMTFVRESVTERTRDLAAKALAADPLSPVQNDNFGLLLFEEGRLEEARAYFERSIELEPAYPFGFSELGLYHKAKGQMDESIAAFQQAVSLSPETVLFHNNLGRALAMTGRADEAIAQFEQTIALRPGEGARYGDLGEVHWDARGRPDDALPWYRQGVAKEPEHPRLNLMLALVLLDLDDLAAAEELVASVEARAWANAPAPHEHESPNDPASVHFRVEIARLNLYLYEGRYAEGADLARRLAETARFWGNLAQLDRPYYEYAPLGYFSLLAGRPDDAMIFPMRAYPRLLEPEPVVDYFSINAAIDLAAALLQSGADGRAELLLDRSLAFLALQSEELRRTRYREEPAEIYALQGRVPEALAALRTAIDNGWRRGWWRAQHKPHYALLRDDPAFRAMLDELAAEAASRRDALSEGARY